MKSLISCAAGIVFCAGVAQAADGSTAPREVHWGAVANWTVTAYPDIGTCELSSYFREGSVMGITLDAKSQSASLFISNPSWVNYIKEGQILPLTVATESKWGNFVATAYRDGSLMAKNVDEVTIKEFALARTIGFAVNGTKLTSLDLSHSKKAVAMGIECSASMIRDYVAANEREAIKATRREIDAFADERGPDGKLLRPDFDALLPQIIELFKADPNRDLAETYEMVRRTHLQGAGAI